MAINNYRLSLWIAEHVQIKSGAVGPDRHEGIGGAQAGGSETSASREPGAGMFKFSNSALWSRKLSK